MLHFTFRTVEQFCNIIGDKRSSIGIFIHYLDKNAHVFCSAELNITFIFLIQPCIPKPFC
ncbi:MAG: hypothetical protein C0593_02945 [Marinilabiliales bacterium]|nr:MAG: hypothetical protein C0593_02945 [Marinilabiliales bacterium]